MQRVPRGIFVGYATYEKRYRVYDPLTKKFILSRDVVFHESVVGIGRRFLRIM